MRTLVNITKKMREYRAATEKFLEMSIPEVRVICDFEKGTVIGLEHREQRQADTLVEDCMLAANTETAKELIVKKIPGIFRIHPEPDSEKLEDFYAFINKTFDMNPGDLSSRSACNHFLENLSDGPEKTVILSHFLRSLPRASYLEENQFHFGLGKGRYCHFTSPIRRYPDLVVHQQFWAADSGGRLKSGKTMAKTARDCSSREEKNDEAYYSANDRLKLKYLQQENSKDESRVYEGMITKISSAGLVVDITELGIYGFVPVELLRGHFRYSKKEAKLNAVRGGQNYKCGNFIYLYLDRIDFIKASAMFRPAVEFG
jgi:ribonuclease R